MMNECRSDELPNIFEYATKELSQDAMICWLIDWSRQPANEDEERALKRLGREFVSAMLSKHGVSLSGDIECVEIHRQDHGIDVLARIRDESGTQHVLLIEDKTGTKDHSDQLVRYCNAVLSRETSVGEVSGCCPIYLKTGNHSLHHAWEIEDKTRVDDRPGYKVFDRRDFLNVLNRYLGNDPLVNQFRSHLRRLEREFHGWREWKPEKRDNWSRQSWEGFFWTLENTLAESSKRRGQEPPDWGDVSNPRGGFLGFWWGPNGGDDRYSLYLQLEVVPDESRSQKLCFKVAAGDDDRSAADYHELVRNAGQKEGTTIERPPRMRSGTTMTVGWWPGDWLAFAEDGHPDVLQTAGNLWRAMRILEMARASDGWG